MTIFNIFVFFMATYAQVFLLGMQSRNVNTGRFLAAAVTSALVGTAQIASVHLIAVSDPWAVWAIGLVAGPAGITSSMAVHRRMYRRKP